MSKKPAGDILASLVHARTSRGVAEAFHQHRHVAMSGLWGSSVAALCAGVYLHAKRPLLLVTGHVDEVDDLCDDLELFTGIRPAAFPALETASLGSVSEEQVASRLEILADLTLEAKTPPKHPRLMVASIQAIMQPVPSVQQLASLARTIRKGQALEPEKLIVWLSDHGYNRLEQVEVPGDFAVRGGIIDIYLPGERATATGPDGKDAKLKATEDGQVGLTVRIDFFGDEVDSIKVFDLDSLGSKENIEAVRVLDLQGKLETQDATHFLNYLPDELIVALWAPLEIQEQANAFLQRLQEPGGIYPLAALMRHAATRATLELSQFETGGASLLENDAFERRAPVQSLQKFETEPKRALAELAELADTHRVAVFCENDGERQRFTELLEQHKEGLSTQVQLPIGYLHRGFVWQEGHSSLALLGHHELFHRYEMRRRVKKMIASRPVDSFLDLKKGDYVVHVAHGIAKFMGIQTIEKEGKNEEVLSLRFAESATLYVPINKVNLVQKYVGGFHGHPQLSKLGTNAWEKQKAKVTEAVMDMASELLEVQASREAEVGTSYPPDTQWQNEFEAEFPYEPTVDQLNSAVEIKMDMQKQRPMDRLLCGDVGYGKTELAMRAAFKACEYGKQVAVLVPTTVLAEQHYRTFRERMVNYPFVVESISRFKTGKQSKDILNRLSKGQVDVIIGTHRLISKDVKFADLGLVVVDEEQRFGVAHKERLKQMRKMVDVLTMSATPIPRTLHMSMLGLRDISSLTTAPQDRRSIVTEVMTWDVGRITAAIARELNREGQIYFVHNRVHNIQEIADKVQMMAPDARILIGHGQMGEGELEQVMLKFVRHEADILVCTTIIESGLDIPNCNTIFINSADRFGLSELHQLRGRVGRYKHRAYCYLVLPEDRPVTPIAAKRLKAIEEYAHLGAGFKIAMRDLELRGAGNILGPEQSGHIATVGYEMYCQLLEEAVRELKNEPKPTLPEAHVDIGLSASIPKTYIPSDVQRLDMYRRLTRCGDLATVQQLQQDMADAFGEIPRPVQLLFALTELRLLAGLFGISTILREPPDVILTVSNAQRAQQAMTGAPGTLRVVDEKTVYFRPPPTYLDSDALLLVLRNLLNTAYAKEQSAESN